MAITLERPAFYENKRYAEYCGLSTDNKADIKANNADEFYEIDTGDVYKYAEGSGWIKQVSQGGGVTPTIGDNGNWYLGTTDTGKPSRGEKGDPGTDGYTPVKGTDYWTDADKTEIVNAVLAALPDGTEVSY